MENQKNKSGNRRVLIWAAALVFGAVLGALNLQWLDSTFNFIAAVYTRLFKFAAVPTIALAITTTLAELGAKKNTGKLFLNTLCYTVLTTLAASVVGALLYLIVKPGNLSPDLAGSVPENLKSVSFDAHILSVIPDNILAPLLQGNVMSILLVSTAAGFAIASLKESENVQLILKGIRGLQEVLYALIRGLVWSLPLGIVAFIAQLSAQMNIGTATESLGKYVAVVLGGNLIQFFIILPLFLLARKINPWNVFRSMLPAVMMALFTKSSVATLPVTVESAENNLKVRPETARFVLPVCCTINMNGCAAFILVTSLFVMQNGGVVLTLPVIALWILISVISAVGNAGVPMGCYFLTLSLMAGIGMPVECLGIILTIYAVIDMIETGVNVWSDSCVCALVDKSFDGKAD